MFERVGQNIPCSWIKGAMRADVLGDAGCVAPACGAVTSGYGY
jgi:hypothetical protein